MTRAKESNRIANVIANLTLTPIRLASHLECNLGRAEVVLVLISSDLRVRHYRY